MLDIYIHYVKYAYLYVGKRAEEVRSGSLMYTYLVDIISVILMYDFFKVSFNKISIVGTFA